MYLKENMFKLRYFLYVILISSIDCESYRLNRDLSDIDSQSVENNELPRSKENNQTIEKDSTIEDNVVENKQNTDTYEQESVEKKAEKDISSNTTGRWNKTMDRTSLEDYEDENILNEENNRIDNDLEPTTDAADFVKKTNVMASGDRSNNTVLENHSIEMNFRSSGRNMQNNSDAVEKKLGKALDKAFVGHPRKMIFKSCGGKEQDSLCRNTLIDYPYAVSIQKKGSHYASGALLDKRWILTVAGEFYNIRESIKFFRARLGSVNCKRGGVVLPLQEVSIHPLYVPGKPGYDLALLRMGEPVNYTDYIRPIRLSVVTDEVLSAKFLTNYWARLIVKGQLLPHNARERVKPNSMRVSTQRLIGWEYCNKMMLEMNEQLQDTSLCLKPLVTHHSLCIPDPGAPVVSEDGLWGITSGWTSKLCYSLPGPTIFTRVSAPIVRSWLDSQLLGIY